MKSKWVWVGIILTLVAVVAVVLGVRLWCERPGVHSFLGDLYVDMEGVGFIFSDEDGEYQGQTPVEVDGHSEGDGTFVGDLVVLSYPIAEEGKISGEPYVEDARDGYKYIQYLPVCTHSETVDGVTSLKEHFCNYTYTWCVRPGDPEFLAVVIHDFDEEDYYTVILAEDEAQAKERYAEFLKSGL